MALLQQLGHFCPECPAIDGVMTMISAELTVFARVSGWVLGQLLWPSNEVLPLEVSDEFGETYAEGILWW